MNNTEKRTIDPTVEFNNQRQMDCRETLTLLKSDLSVFWSWGPNGFTNFRNKALRFRVQGHHHKGYVYISVSGLDLYDVLLTNLKNEVVDDTLTDLYFDQLVEVIDNRIERIADYRK